MHRTSELRPDFFLATVILTAADELQNRGQRGVVEPGFHRDARP
jgi:hypothetical protein